MYFFLSKTLQQFLLPQPFEMSYSDMGDSKHLKPMSWIVIRNSSPLVYFNISKSVFCSRCNIKLLVFTKC